MSKSTFYFVLLVMILVDVVQSRYQKKLLDEQARLAASRKLRSIPFRGFIFRQGMTSPREKVDIPTQILLACLFLRSLFRFP